MPAIALAAALALLEEESESGSDGTGTNEEDDAESGSGSERLGTDEGERAVSSRSTNPEPTEADEPSLDDAIEKAPAARLRSILKFVCEKNEFARQLTKHHLLAPVGNGKSRKRKRFETCTKCGNEYDVCSSAWTCSPRHRGKKYRARSATTDRRTHCMLTMS
jgi:hypothetical protein